jgi:hypothetical protein
MSQICYQQQQIEELEYNFILNSPVDLGLNILESRKIRWQNLKLELSIIGASHLIRGDLQQGAGFTELLACIDLGELPAVQKRKSLLTAEGFNYRQKLTAEFDYQFSLRVYSFNISDYKAVNDSLLKQKSNYFYYQFPGGAVTAIKYNKYFNKLEWVTYHSYSEQQKVVETKASLRKSIQRGGFNAGS